MNQYKFNSHRTAEDPYFPLTWFDPRNKVHFYAGHAYYNQRTRQYELCIEEDSLSGPLFLNLSHQYNNGRTFYNLKRSVQNPAGFSNQRKVGHGVFDPTLDRYIQIYYGSKFKTLLLDLGDQRHLGALAQASNS